jgi:hypothetical protein
MEPTERVRGMPMLKATDMVMRASQVVRKKNLNVACDVLPAFWHKLELIRHTA